LAVLEGPLKFWLSAAVPAAETTAAAAVPAECFTPQAHFWQLVLMWSQWEQAEREPEPKPCSRAELRQVETANQGEPVPSLESLQPQVAAEAAAGITSDLTAAQEAAQALAALLLDLALQVKATQAAHQEVAAAAQARRAQTQAAQAAQDWPTASPEPQ
jgi:hypothetical protein